METWQKKILENPIFKSEFPFNSHFLDIDGNRVHYVDEGQGPTLLLLHGNPAFSFLYRKIIGTLKRQLRVIALDYPGFGLSIAKNGYDLKPESHSKVVEIFVKTLNLKDITVFVQDWGGPIGLGFAGRNPELISSLIIGNTWAWPVNGDRHFEIFSKLLGGPIGRFLILKFNIFVSFLMPAGAPKGKISKDILSIYKGVMTKDRRVATNIFPREIIAGKVYLQQVADGLALLRDKPVLFLWGDKDDAFRIKELRQFERYFPNHKTVILEGAGHFIQEDMPDEICAEIVSWMPC